MPAYQSYQLCAVRFARLDSAGAPVAGAANGYVLLTSQTLTVGFESEEGTEVVSKSGCGNVVSSLKGADATKRATGTLTVLDTDYALMALVLGGTLLGTPSAPSGWLAPALDAIAPNICLEFWTKAIEGSSQVIDPATTPDPTWFHAVIPRTTWTIGETTYEDDLGVVPLDFQGFENLNITADGPFNDWPTAVVTAGGARRVFNSFYDGDVPTTEGPVAVP